MRTPRQFRPAFECMLARIAPSTIAPVAHHVEARMLSPHHAAVVAASHHGLTAAVHTKTPGAAPCDSTGDPSTDPDGSGGSDPVYLDPPTTTSTTSTVC